MWRIFMHADAADYALMALGFLGAIGDGISLPLTFYFASSLFNDVGLGTSTPSIDRNTSNIVVIFLYVAAGSLCFAFLEGYCWTQTGERQASRMRTRYLRAVLRQDVGYFDVKGLSPAEVVNGVSNDSMVIQDFLSEKVPNFIMHSSTFLASYIVAFVLMWRLVVVVFPTALLLIIPGLTYTRVLLNLARMKQVMYTDASEIAEQSVSSIRTVYASTAEHRVMSAFNAALANSMRIGTVQGLVKGLALGSTGITFAIWALMVWYSSRLIMFRGAQGGSAFVAGITIVNGGLSLGSSLTNVEYFGDAAAAAGRIYEVIMRRPLIDSESSEGDVIGEVEGEVEFRMVKFAYPVRPDIEVLKGFSFKVAAKRKVALVGASGSGKSTAIALLQRFYDPTGGEILLDGIDTRRLKLKWLREQMGLVSQEPALFSTSIKENILYGKEDAIIEEVVAAIKIANASVFISQLPLGIDTQVGERGVQLSGGQKQRIAIARAIIRSPKILLLDEATSALDSESEHVVQDAINSAANDCTTIIVAHRLSTIRNADSIAFVHAGQVIELGSHNDLIRETGGHYASLVRLQESQPSHDAAETDTLTISPSIPNHKIHSANVSNSLSPNHNHNPVSKSNRSAVKEDVKFAMPIRPSFWQLLMLNAPEWRQATLGCIGAMLVGAVQPLYGVFVGNIVSIYFVKDNNKMKEQTRTYSLLLAGLSMFCFIVNLLQHSNFAIMGEYLTKRVREKMLSKMLTFEVGWFDQEENSSGRICSRLAQDASAVRSLVGDRMALVIQTLSAVVISYTIGILIAWRLALVIISVQPIVILCIYARFRLLKTMSKKAIKSQSKSSDLAAEAINNLRNIATFSSQGRILRLFKLAQVVPHSQGHRQSWLAGFGLGLSKCISIGNLALALWYGSCLVIKGYISGKDYFQTLLVLINTGRLIAESGSLTTDITKGVNSISSVFSIFNRAAQIDPKKPDGIYPESLYGDIELQNVEFSYPTRPDVPVMCNFSLSIKASTSTALVGQSGSGKSTVISLIERFYDPLHGAVYIDGKDIRTYNLRSLRRLIGLVGQEPVLFAGSVRDNIMYGIDKCINDAELEAAAKVANAHDFICSLPNGYRTSCGRNGMQLSGGQKQRIAIARAVLRNPRILLLDEATSALDGQSEKLVQEALDRIMVGRTSVVVAHRLSTIKNCDVIAVVEKGVLLEKGSHASLMAKGHTGKYFGLVSLQSEVKTTCTK